MSQICIPLEAWKIAREITPLKETGRATLEATFKMASALSSALSGSDFSPCIDCLRYLFDEGKDVLPVLDQALSAAGVGEGKSLPFFLGDSGGDSPDQLFSGHTGSSSGGSDGESAGELPTPSRTETAPDREGGQ